jgi:alkyl hydroperoxide reductase subunit F
MYDLIIIGGGPAGIAAGVYASRKQLKTLFITKEWGGQSTVSLEIQNWIGTPAISGTQLAKDLENHLKTYADRFVEIRSNTLVTHLKKDNDVFTAKLSNDEEVQAKSVLIATGSQRKRLLVPGADEFEHKGLTYCATCDGPLFAGQDVAVIGAGNAGFETAAQLLAYAKTVTLFQRSATAKADPVTVEKVLAHPNMRSITNATITAVHGEKFVSGLSYKENDGEEKILPVTGIFVEIGMMPNTNFLADAVCLDEYNRVEIDPWTQRTSTLGIWAAGDCTNIRYHQNNISAGDAVKALEDIYIYLKTQQ